MIDSVAPVTRVKAVSLSVAASLASRQGSLLRRRRLRWLTSLREALGEGAALLDEGDAEDADERIYAETRDRISAALGTIEELNSLSEDPFTSAVTDGDSGASITVAELARRIGAAGERSLRTQARLGAATVLALVGAPSPLAVNGV